MEEIVNAKKGFLGLGDIFKRKNGRKGDNLFNLTDAEKVQVGLMMREVASLQTRLAQTDAALGELVGSIVKQRGMDTALFGVNLEAGKILPLNQKVKTGGKRR